MLRSIFAAALTCLACHATPGATASLSVLASFNGSNGDGPYGGLVADAAGTLYGTTYLGGAHGFGTVFSVTSGGALTTLASFDGSNGANPFGRPVIDASGTLSGTTTGENLPSYGDPNYGTVYRLTTSGTLTTLASFDGANGATPRGALYADGSGALYGTTVEGGASNAGTVFRLDQDGTLTTLASFSGANGRYPQGNLIADQSGTLYGRTLRGGAYSSGTVFSVTSNGTLTTLASFNNQLVPSALTIDAAGTLYGTTVYGGFNDGEVPYGYGTVFSLPRGGTLTTLASFLPGATAYPTGGVIVDAVGTLYGTTSGDGNNGSVFRLTRGGTLTTLANFNGANGAAPDGNLIVDASGTLYGVAPSGGASRLYGAVFKISGVGWNLGDAEIGTTPSNPVMPTVKVDPDTNSPVFEFATPVSGLWYDPPFADGFTYSLSGGASFSKLTAPPLALGFAGPFTISSGGAILGTVSPGADFLFGSGIHAFTLSGITPGIDSAVPGFSTAFPVYLSWTGTSSSLTITPVFQQGGGGGGAIPEPEIWAMLIAGFGSIGLAARRRRTAVLA